jgi:hypothetical protein
MNEIASVANGLIRRLMLRLVKSDAEKQPGTKGAG